MCTQMLYPYQMTDMQMLDDASAMLPATNEVNLLEDWKLLGDYSLDNAFIPCFLALSTVLFGVAAALGWYGYNASATRLLFFLYMSLTLFF